MLSMRRAIASALGGVARYIEPRIEPQPPKARADADPRLTSEAPKPTFEGASMARRLSPWRPSRQALNAALQTEGPALRARTRSLVRNSPYGSSASDSFAAYAAGTGIKPSSMIENPDQKKAVQQAWSDWTDEADADGLTDFYGLQAMIAQALFDVGEVFARLRPRFASDGLSVPVQVQLIPAEQLDSSYTALLANGNQIRMGIEFNAIGQRVAYHFWRFNPGDATFISAYSYERVRVPAESVLHIYKPLEPGQIRGRPWLTPAMVKLYDLDQYDDAELARKKVAALLTGWITKGLNSDAAIASLVDGATDPDTTGSVDAIFEPGVLNVLPDGMDVKFSDPSDVGPNYEAFQVRNLYPITASTGLPYHSVTGDVSRANYSSLRAAQLDTKRRLEQFQWQTLVFQFCRPIWRAWLPAAVLAGAVRLPGFARDPRTFLRVKWITPKWDWVDPLKDMQAEKLAVDAGFKARSDVIESTGEDAEATDERIAADHAREEKLGLKFAVGISKNPDPLAGTDTQPTGADVTGAGNQNGPGQQPSDGDAQNAAAAEDLDRMATLLSSMAPPQVKVEVPITMPQGTRKIVTKHDAKGRISEIIEEPMGARRRHA